MELNENGFNNDEYASMPEDHEYDLTLTKLEIGYITVGIQAYIDKLIANVDTISRDKELIEHLFNDIHYLVGIGKKLFDSTNIAYSDDYFLDSEKEIEELRADLLGE